MLGNLTGWHFLALLAIILLVFGAAKLPALAKSMGQSARVFKGEMKAMKEDGTPTSTVEPVVAPLPTVQAEVPAARVGAPDSHS